jgi:hypothetical protein
MKASAACLRRARTIKATREEWPSRWDVGLCFGVSACEHPSACRIVLSTPGKCLKGLALPPCSSNASLSYPDMVVPRRSGRFSPGGHTGTFDWIGVSDGILPTACVGGRMRDNYLDRAFGGAALHRSIARIVMAAFDQSGHCTGAARAS